MAFEVGQLVERRQPMDGHRVGRIQREVTPDSDVWYVRVVETGLMYIAKGKDLRPASEPGSEEPAHHP